MVEAGLSDKRLAVLSIVEADKELLRSFRPMLDSCPDQILTEFYQHIRCLPEPAA